MTNWFGSSIKADLADLLRKNPDPTDILNFVLQHGDPEDLANSMSDEAFGDLVVTKIKGLVSNSSVRSSIIEAVAEVLYPEDVFTEYELDSWAEMHGWKDARKVDKLIKAIHELDSFLEGTSLTMADTWRDEIVHMQDMMQELED